FDEDLRRHAQLVRSNHVVLRAVEGSRPTIKPQPIDRDGFAAELRRFGVTDQRASHLADAAFRSMTAFQNEAPASGSALRRWASQLSSRVARRAALLGRWNEARTGDAAELARATGTANTSAMDVIRPLAEGEDPLFAAVGPVWSLVSP